LSGILLIHLEPSSNSLGDACSGWIFHHRAFHPKLLEPSRQPKPAWPRFITRAQDHLLAMRLAQPSNPFFHRVQIIADSTSLAHFPLAPFLRCRRDDTVLVDIQSKIEFFFHSSVFVCSSCLKLQRSGTPLSRPVVRLCSLTGVAREKI